MDPNHPHAQHQPVTFSMPLRMEAKRKRTRAGTAALAVGVPILCLGIFGFARGGAELLGVWGVGVGALLIGVGAFFLKKASAGGLG